MSKSVEFRRGYEDTKWKMYQAALDAQRQMRPDQLDSDYELGIRKATVEAYDEYEDARERSRRAFYRTA